MVFVEAGSLGAVGSAVGSVAGPVTGSVTVAAVTVTDAGGAAVEAGRRGTTP